MYHTKTDSERQKCSRLGVVSLFILIISKFLRYYSFHYTNYRCSLENINNMHDASLQFRFYASPLP